MMIMLQKIVEKVVFRKVCLGGMGKIAVLGVLAEALGKCFGEGCSSTLDLRNTESEKKYGFASLLWVSCVKCGALNSINTSKSHRNKERSTSV